MKEVEKVENQQPKRFKLNNLTIYSIIKILKTLKKQLREQKRFIF